MIYLLFPFYVFWAANHHPKHIILYNHCSSFHIFDFKLNLSCWHVFGRCSKQTLNLTIRFNIQESKAWIRCKNVLRVPDFQNVWIVGWEQSSKCWRRYNTPYTRHYWIFIETNFSQYLQFSSIIFIFQQQFSNWIRSFLFLVLSSDCDRSEILDNT